MALTEVQRVAAATAAVNQYAPQAPDEIKVAAVAMLEPFIHAQIQKPRDRACRVLPTKRLSYQKRGSTRIRVG